MAISGQVWVNRSLYALGALAPGETPNASDSQACLDRGNSIIDNASIQEQMATAAVSASITLIAATESYNIGTRVSRIVSASATLPTVTDMTYPLDILDAKSYNGIRDKSAQSTLPGAIFYDAGFPTGAIKVVPIPLVAGTISYLAWAAQTQFATLATSVTLLPGYELYLVTELAIQLAPFFPMCRVSPSLEEANKQAKNEIRALNAKLWGVTPISEGNEVAA